MVTGSHGGVQDERVGAQHCCMDRKGLVAGGNGGLAPGQPISRFGYCQEEIKGGRGRYSFDYRQISVPAAPSWTAPLMSLALAAFSTSVSRLVATAAPLLSAIRVGPNRHVTGLICQGDTIVTTDQALPIMDSYTVVLSNHHSDRGPPWSARSGRQPRGTSSGHAPAGGEPRGGGTTGRQRGGRVGH